MMLSRTGAFMLFCMIVLSAILSPRCWTEPALAVRSGALGSRLAPDGAVDDDRLEFRFDRRSADAKRTNRELFDYFYFQGDTICFSFELSKDLAPGSARVWFVDPLTGEHLPAERIDVRGRRVSGFSLVGSLLRDRHRVRHAEPVPPGRWCCERIPVAVAIVIADGDGASTGVISGRFSITYE